MSDEIYEYALPYNMPTHGVQTVYNTESRRISIFYIDDEGKILINTLEPNYMANFVKYSDGSWDIVGPKIRVEN